MASYTITLNFVKGLNKKQKELFIQASRIWESVILSDNSSFDSEGSGLIINVYVKRIDGVGGTKAIARPTHLRSNSGLPYMGEIIIDTSDLKRANGNMAILRLAIHEIAHVLGFGSLWQAKNLISGYNTRNPVFIGKKAQIEFGKLLHTGPKPVPVENEGNQGTLLTHWREKVFGGELMTSILDNQQTTLSRLTIASLEDIGYKVRYNSAAEYHIPSTFELSLEGAWAKSELKHVCSMCG
jgi:hypothetical protein